MFLGYSLLIRVSVLKDLDKVSFSLETRFYICLSPCIKSLSLVEIMCILSSVGKSAIVEQLFSVGRGHHNQNVSIQVFLQLMIFTKIIYQPLAAGGGGFGGSGFGADGGGFGGGNGGFGSGFGAGFFGGQQDTTGAASFGSGFSFGDNSSQSNTGLSTINIRRFR